MSPVGGSGRHQPFEPSEPDRGRAGPPDQLGHVAQRPHMLVVVRRAPAVPVGVEVQGAHPGRSGPVHVGEVGISHVDGIGRRNAEGIESQSEDPRVGLLDADNGRVDHDRHRHAVALADLAHPGRHHLVGHRPIRVGHHGQADAGRSQHPEAFDRTRQHAMPPLHGLPSPLQSFGRLVDPVLGHPGRAGQGLLVQAPVELAGGVEPSVERGHAGVVGPIQRLRRHRPTGRLDGRGQHLVVGRGEHATDVQQDRLDQSVAAHVAAQVGGPHRLALPSSSGARRSMTTWPVSRT